MPLFHTHNVFIPSLSPSLLFFLLLFAKSVPSLPAELYPTVLGCSAPSFRSSSHLNQQFPSLCKNAFIFLRPSVPHPSGLLYLWDHCPLHGIFHQTLLSALHSWVSILLQHHEHRIISILRLLAHPTLEILLIEEFPFLSNPFVSNILAPTRTTSLGSERERMVVNIPLWSPYPVNQPTTAFPPTGRLLGSLCFKVPELISALGWQIRFCGTWLGCELQFSPSPPWKHLPGEKTEEYMDAEALLLETETLCYFMGNNHCLAISFQQEKVIHVNCLADTCTPQKSFLSCFLLTYNS